MQRMVSNMKAENEVIQQKVYRYVLTAVGDQRSGWRADCDLRESDDRLSIWVCKDAVK